MDFDKWLRYGIDQGYCSEQVCSTHAGVPMSPTEDQLWDSGDDPCAHVVRLGTEKDWESEAVAYAAATNSD